METKRPVYTLKRYRRAKYMRLIVRADGRVVVTSPFGVRKRDIERFIIEKQQWIEEAVHSLKKDEPQVTSTSSYKDYVKYKKQAHAFVSQKVKMYNKIYGFSFNKIYIKNQKTLWGSCSNRRNLNFNYRLLFLPECLADYVVVHELCHLKEFNHSARFWMLVRQAISEYQEIQKELRGMSLKVE